MRTHLRLLRGPPLSPHLHHEVPLPHRLPVGTKLHSGGGLPAHNYVIEALPFGQVLGSMLIANDEMKQWGGRT